MQGFQGDISHLVEDEPDIINVRGVLSKSGEMRIENQGTLRLISFNRPKVLNALSLNMVRELTELVKGTT